MTTIETLCLVVVVLVLVFSIIGSILLYNFMQLLSTINKRMVATIGDILGNIQFETPKINDVVDREDYSASYNDILNEDDTVIGEGFNPHNYDPYTGDSE